MRYKCKRCGSEFKWFCDTCLKGGVSVTRDMVHWREEKE